MNEKIATKMIQHRIGQMVKDTKVQAVLLKDKEAGKTDKEIKEKLTLMAIATLVGI